MFCRKCGAELREGTKFCVKCGTPVNQIPVTPNTTEPKEKIIPNPQEVQKNQFENQKYQFEKQPENKKSSVGLIVAIMLLVIVLLGGVAVTLYFTVIKDGAIEEIFNNDDKDDNDDDDDDENTEDTEDTETEGADSDTEAGDSSEEALAETTAEVAEEGSVTAGEERVIEDQSFKVELVPHGSVKFVSYAPANEESDVVFKIMKKEKVVTVLPPLHENNSLADSEAVFVDVEEVFFKDYNIDGVDDIFVNCLYKYSADSSSTFMECRVFRGSAEGDYYMQTSLSKVGSEYAQTDGTIGYYVDELRDLYADYDLPFSNSISYSKEELEMLTEEQLMKARNEIYARHGYWFENEDLWKHFSNRDWYEPYTDVVPDSALNEHEIHNRDLIIELEEKY